MKRIGWADHVIVVLSDKYLHSPYCMTELYGIYQRSVGEKEDFLRRIIPLALDDARFGTWRDRDSYAAHWETEFKEMEQAFRRLGVAATRSTRPCGTGPTTSATCWPTSTTFYTRTGLRPS